MSTLQKHVCRSEADFDGAYDRIKEAIATNTYMLVEVKVDDTDEESPNSYVYTVGLADMGYVELIVTGDFPMDVLTQVISALTEQWDKTGINYGYVGELLADENELDMAMILRELDSELVNKEYCPLIELGTGNPAEIAQLVYPDDNGEHPSDEDDEERQDYFAQPLLPEPEPCEASDEDDDLDDTLTLDDVPEDERECNTNDY